MLFAIRMIRTAITFRAHIPFADWEIDCLKGNRPIPDEIWSANFNAWN